MTDKRREEHAQRLLNDKLFDEAFETLKKDLMDRWNNSGSNEVRCHIESIVETGRMSEILDKQHPIS